MQRPPNDMRVGVAWYTEAEWQRLRQVAADADALDSTYADWLKGAEKTLRHLAATGIVAERIDVTVAQLQRWCEQHGRPIDGTARSEFASELLRRKYEGTGGASGA